MIMAPIVMWPGFRVIVVVVFIVPMEPLTAHVHTIQVLTETSRMNGLFVGRTMGSAVYCHPFYSKTPFDCFLSSSPQ